MLKVENEKLKGFLRLKGLNSDNNKSKMDEIQIEVIDKQPIHPSFQDLTLSDFDKKILSFNFTTLRHPEYKSHSTKIIRI